MGPPLPTNSSSAQGTPVSPNPYASAKGSWGHYQLLDLCSSYCEGLLSAWKAHDGYTVPLRAGMSPASSSLMGLGLGLTPRGRR